VFTQYPDDLPDCYRDKPTFSMRRKTMSSQPKRFSRRSFLKVAGTSVAASVLAACAPATTAPTEPPAPAATQPPADTQAPEATKAPEPTKAPEATPTTAAPATLETEVNYYFLAWGPMNDSTMVADEMSKISLEKIKTKIKLVPMDWSGFNEKLQLSLAAGENIDLMYTCTWANNFYANVSNGNLLALDELLPANAPTYYKSIKPEIWEAGKVSGQLYGAINEQIWVSYGGFDVRKDIADKYNIDPTQYKSFEDFEQFCDLIKSKEPDMYPTGWFAPDEKQTYWPHYWGIDDLGISVGTQPYVGVYYDDEALKASFAVELPEFAKAIDIARRWYTKGYVPAEPTSGEDFVAQMKAGKYAMVPYNSAKPGRNSEDKAKYGFEFYNIGISPNIPPLMSTGSIAATMNGIARTCKQPERAAQIMELLNTDVAFYNLICKGIQGKHWVWEDEAKKVIKFPDGVTADMSTYNPNTDWMFGNQFNAYYVDMAQAEEDVWKKTKELNDSGVVSKAMGFAFVQDPVTTEIAQLTTVISELGVPVAQGRVDPAQKMPEYISKLKAAGGEKFMAELQSQLDKWKASKK
jgi:putative aldouronate transport system substrate-binding protein